MLGMGMLSVQAQTKAERKQARKEKATAIYMETKELIDSGAFIFKGDWANPLGGARISIINNLNSMTLKEGNLKAFLPYFGVAHRSVGYANNRGIEFDVPIKESDYTVTVDDEKQRIRIEFSAKEKNELFNATLTVYSKGRASMTIASSNRTSINYTGTVTALEGEL